VLSCVGRGLCDGLVTRPEESYRMYQLYVIKKPEWLRKNLSSEEKVLRKKNYICSPQACWRLKDGPWFKNCWRPRELHIWQDCLAGCVHAQHRKTRTHVRASGRIVAVFDKERAYCQRVAGVAQSVRDHWLSDRNSTPAWGRDFYLRHCCVQTRP
jgi:hypothetical protein